MNAEEPTGPTSQQLDEVDSQLAKEIKRQAIEASRTKRTPREAVDDYLEHRHLAPSTEMTYQSSLNFFVQWCEQVKGIDEMHVLSSADLAEYRVWRRDESSSRVNKLSPATDASQQTIVRAFIEYCESIGAVPSGLSECVVVPIVSSKGDGYFRFPF